MGDDRCLHVGAQRALHWGTHVRTAVEQWRVRLAAGGASMKEMRSYAACLLRLSTRARW
jgi:hypothetical protein